MNGEMSGERTSLERCPSRSNCCGSGAVERNCAARRKPWRRRRHQGSHEAEQADVKRRTRVPRVEAPGSHST
jgi:hypothetical protein